MGSNQSKPAHEAQNDTNQRNHDTMQKKGHLREACFRTCDSNGDNVQSCNHTAQTKVLQGSGDFEKKFSGIQLSPLQYDDCLSKNGICRAIGDQNSISIYLDILHYGGNMIRICFDRIVKVLSTATVEGHIQLATLLLSACDFDLKSAADSGRHNYSCEVADGVHADTLRDVLKNSKELQKIISITDANKENILHKACRRGSPDALRALLEILTDEEKLEMLSMKNVLNRTPQDYVFGQSVTSSSINEKKLIVILQNLPSHLWQLILKDPANIRPNLYQYAIGQGLTQLLGMLSNQIGKPAMYDLVFPDIGFSFVDMLKTVHRCSENYLQVVDILTKAMEDFDTEDLSSHMMSRDNDCDTVFHKIIAYGLVELACSVLENMSSERKCLELLSARNNKGQTALFYLIKSHAITSSCRKCCSITSSLEVMKILAQFITPGEFHHLLCAQDTSDYTILHYAVNQYQNDAVRIILSCFDDSQKSGIMTMHLGPNQENLMMLSLVNVEVLETLLASVRQEERYMVLKQQAKDGNTALHFAVKHGLPQIKAVLQSLDDIDAKINLTKIKNENDQAVIDLAQPFAHVVRYLKDIQRERVELVAVSDVSDKDKKGDGRNEKQRICQRDAGNVRYTQAIDDILFRNQVTAGRVDTQEICTVYHLEPHEQKAKFKEEGERLLTYGNEFANHFMTATSLSRAGLISCKKGDEVACVWCDVKFGNFKRAVDAKALHWAYSEKVCEFIINYTQINIPLVPMGKSFLDLSEGAPGSTLPLDSGFHSLSVTQNPSMAAAAQVLTFNTESSELEDSQDGEGAHICDIKARYIHSETRTEPLATPKSTPSPQSLSLGQNSLMVSDNPMRHELTRLTSFIKNHWNKRFAEPLACAGFYLIRDTDEMFTLACPFCDNKINGVPKDTTPMFTKEKDHSPLQVHTLKFPACPFVQGTKLGPKGNVPILSGASRWEVSTVVTAAQITVGSELEGVGIATVHAKHPPMAVLDRRMESFLTVSYDHPKGAEELSSAGFFFAGRGDSVTCFWCGVVCGNWSVAEDAWIRHARSSRSCQFVLNEKGAEFISTAVEEHGLWAENHRDEDRIRNVTTRMIRPRMDATVVQTVIGMGYSREHVKTAVINRLKKLKQ